MDAQSPKQSNAGGRNISSHHYLLIQSALACDEPGNMKYQVSSFSEAHTAPCMAFICPPVVVLSSIVPYLADTSRFARENIATAARAFGHPQAEQK